MPILATTAAYCVIGKPVAHSMSPLMHNAALQAAGLDAVYLAFNVEDIEAAVRGIRGLGIKGASITIPHKISVMTLLDEIEDTALKIGAVNTIVNDDGRLKGYNTDCEGALKAITDKTIIKGKRILMIGAGGAARAVGYGLAREGGVLSISNRGEERGRSLADEIGCEFIDAKRMIDIKWDVIVNTTSIGMSPEVEKIPVSTDILHPECIAMDIVYNPVKTAFLAAAEKKSCATVDGVSMFVHQGAQQFELWTGKKAPVSEMDALVRHHLENR